MLNTLPLPQRDTYRFVDPWGNQITQWREGSEVGTSSFFLADIVCHKELRVLLWVTKEAARLVRPRDEVLADGIRFRLALEIDANHFEAKPVGSSEDLRLRARILQIVDARKDDRLLRNLVEEAIRRLDARNSFAGNL